MLRRVTLLLEVFAIILCIHGIYDKKVKLDMETIALCLLSLGVTEAVVYFGLNNLFTMCIYVFIVVYCIRKFQDSLVGSINSVLLMLIVLTMLQFAFVILASLIFPKNQELRMLTAGLLQTVSVLGLLPVIKLHKLRMMFRKRDKFINAVFCIVIIMVLMIVIEGKFEKQLNVTSFVFAVPMAVALVMLLNKWDAVKEEKEHVKNELSVTKSMQEEYDDLLTAVRLREHGFKNHITALQSMKLPKELEKEQEDYYNAMCEANKYNKLLFLGNRVVSGFLYRKFCEIENYGVITIYEARGCFADDVIAVYHLIEMLGILIDNAAEAQADIMENKRMRFLFHEEENDYWFKVLNPYPHVSYAEIESWFLLGNSGKGNERGLGLYYIKKLCKECNVDLACRNAVWEGENWIEFSIGIKKADKM